MQTSRFVDDLKKEIAYEKEYKYQVPYDQSEYYKTITGVIADALAKNDSLNPSSFDWFKDFFEFHFEYSMFACTELGRNETALEHLGKAVCYGSIALLQAPKTCGCVPGNNPFLVSNKAVFMASLLLLTQEDNAFETAVAYLIESLNGNNCIIKRGYNKATISWFLLRIFGLFSHREINLHPLLQPKLPREHEEVLAQWDTGDETQIQKFIDVLCEIHLAQAALDLADADLDDDIYNAKYRELYLPAMYAFPFEILVWFKLRERKGLQNPNAFSHPLMNTPIAKFFLALEAPLPKPTALPHAKDLLEKIKVKCPAVEIPPWVP